MERRNAKSCPASSAGTIRHQQPGGMVVPTDPTKEAADKRIQVTEAGPKALSAQAHIGNLFRIRYRRCSRPSLCSSSGVRNLEGGAPIVLPEGSHPILEAGICQSMRVFSTRILAKLAVPSNLCRSVRKAMLRLEAIFRKRKKRPVGKSWRTVAPTTPIAINATSSLPV